MICKVVGHQPKTCPYNKFRRDYSDRTQTNLEAGKPIYEPTPATAAAEGNTAAEEGTTATEENTTAAEGNTTAAEEGTTAAPGAEAGDAAGGFDDMYDVEPAGQFAAW